MKEFYDIEYEREPGEGYRTVMTVYATEDEVCRLTRILNAVRGDSDGQFISSVA